MSFPPEKLSTRVVLTDPLSPTDRRIVHDLFERTYEEADHDYLDRSLTRLRFLALAFDGEKPVGFALADARRVLLPRLSAPLGVILAGLCCIDPDYRRMGLFARLESLAVRESGLVVPGERTLVCGRMAHPASLRILRGNPTVVPRIGHVPTEWQKEIGLAVAGLYGVELDPETFVVKGKGKPIGFPRLRIEVSEEEWLPFRPVDRRRGDSLLAVAWSPDAPPGW